MLVLSIRCANWAAAFLRSRNFWSRAARALAVRAVRSAVFAHDMWAV